MSQLLDDNQPSGPVTVGDLQVIVDRDLCIGAATCVAVAPETYTLDSEAIAIILESAKNDTEENIIEGAKACPVAAVQVSKGDQVIFPE